MEPTITVTFPCDACKGTGRIPEKKTQIARGHQVEPEHPCEVCAQRPGPAGVDARQLTVTEFKRLLDESP